EPPALEDAPHRLELALPHRRPAHRDLHRALPGAPGAGATAGSPASRLHHATLPVGSIGIVSTRSTAMSSSLPSSARTVASSRPGAAAVQRPARGTTRSVIAWLGACTT